MGISKAMMEKVAVAKSRNLNDSTIISCTRYGNVMASRGSVIPLFINQIRNNEEITITDPNMTRFMMSLDDAVDLVMFAFKNANNGDIFVQKAPAATIEMLANTLKHLLDKPEHVIKIIGTRHGEKLYETLLTREEMVSAEDMGDYYRLRLDHRDLNYKSYFSEGDTETVTYEDYHSHNTERLDLEGVKKLLLSLPEVQAEIENV